MRGARTLVDQAFLLRAFGGYLFPGVPEGQLGELVDRATVESVGKDAEVFKEGETADAFFLIRNGMVKITKQSGGKEVVLSYLVAGNFFGEAALFSDMPRTATVTTIFPSDLIKVSKRDFDKFLAAQCKDAVLEAKLRAQFTQWHENDAKLQPLAQRSFLVKEVVQTSTDLSALGAAGLAALDNIAKGTAAPDQWKAQQTAAIQEIQKPKAQLLIIPAAAVQKLIDAASTGGACSQAR